jgi:hypothetical protein
MCCYFTSFKPRPWTPSVVSNACVTQTSTFSTKQPIVARFCFSKTLIPRAVCRDAIQRGKQKERKEVGVHPPTVVKAEGKPPLQAVTTQRQAHMSNGRPASNLKNWPTHPGAPLAGSGGAGTFNKGPHTPRQSLQTTIQWNRQPNEAGAPSKAASLPPSKPKLEPGLHNNSTTERAPPTNLYRPPMGPAAAHQTRCPTAPSNVAKPLGLASKSVAGAVVPARSFDKRGGEARGSHGAMANVVKAQAPGPAAHHLPNGMLGRAGDSQADVGKGDAGPVSVYWNDPNARKVTVGKHAQRISGLVNKGSGPRL